MSSRILCCFYTQFDVEKGCEIICQFPKDFITNEDFIKISEYIIPKPELCNKNLSLKLGKSYLIGYPINLTSKNYNRAKFQFNFSLILEHEEYENNKYTYESLLKKISKTFEEFEINSGYDLILNNTNNIVNFVKNLYFQLCKYNSNRCNDILRLDIHLIKNKKEKDYISNTTNNINEIKENHSIYIEDNDSTIKNLENEDLISKKNLSQSNSNMYNYNNKLHNTVNLNENTLSNIIDKEYYFYSEFNFKLLDVKYVDLRVKEYLVPVFISYLPYNEWKYYDFSIASIIKKINGIYHIKKIADIIGLSTKYVKYIIFNLLINKSVCLIDIFQFSNIYNHSDILLDFYNNKLKLLKEFKLFYLINKLHNHVISEISSLNNIDIININNLEQADKLNEASGNKQFNISNCLDNYFNESKTKKYKYSSKLNIKNKNNNNLEDENLLIRYRDNLNNLINKDLDEDYLFTLYCNLGMSENVQKFLENNYIFDLDINLFVAYGVYKNLINRVHMYGIIKGNNVSSGTELFQILSELLDGSHNMDEVCCCINKSLKEVITLMRTVQGFDLLYK